MIRESHVFVRNVRPSFQQILAAGLTGSGHDLRTYIGFDLSGVPFTAPRSRRPNCTCASSTAPRSVSRSAIPSGQPHQSRRLRGR